jgi:hypothetical protein
MPSWLDSSLYPELNPPEVLESQGDRLDFIARLCAAWDFGVLPTEETVREVTQPAWRDSVDACRFLTSPAYHLLRRWHCLPRLPYLGDSPAYIRDDPSLQFI